MNLEERDGEWSEVGDEGPESMVEIEGALSDGGEGESRKRLTMIDVAVRDSSTAKVPASIIRMGD